MKKTWTEDELKELGSQLGQPKGENGIKTAERMAVSNKNMIFRTIALLNIQNGDHVLEIGPGNGSHVTELLKGVTGANYMGIDISSTMIEESIKINKALVKTGAVNFTLSDGNQIAFPEATFHKIFTVNTIYFWKDPDAYAREMYRVLKPGGSVFITFADKEFMKNLPFTKWEFQLYDQQLVSSLLIKAGFSIKEVSQEQESIEGNLGELVNRDFTVITARK